MTYLAHWVRLDEQIHVCAEGDAVIASALRDDNAASHGLLVAEAAERIGAEQHRPVVVMRLELVAA